jgi:Undecaprenyl-phosphate glucose phosphotransferase
MSQEEQNMATFAPPQEWGAIVRASAAARGTRVVPRTLFADRSGMVALAAYCQRIGDALLVVTVLAACAHLSDVAFDDAFVGLSTIVALATLIFFRPLAFAQPWARAGVSGMCAGVLGAWMMVAGTLFLVGIITGEAGRYPAGPIIEWLVVSPLLLLGWHAVMRALLVRYADARIHRRAAIVVGANQTGLRLAGAMTARSGLGLLFHGFFDDRNAARLARGAPARLSGRIADVPGVVEREHISVIYIALPMSQHPRILALLDGLRDTTASIYFAPDIAAFDPIQGRVADLDGLPVVAVCESPFSGFDGVVKRAFDALFAATALLLLSPLFGLIALGVKRSAPGPILFRQRRYGIDGEEILVYKFRSMRVCEDGEHVEQAQRVDPRVTRFGAFLRRTSLDELPQLINVLRGEMSLVGPRPHAVAHNELYRRLIKGYMLRHKVRPGITGWAQVNGLRGETERLDKMRRRLEYDLYYLRHWSLWLDFKILLMTLPVLLCDRHAY